MEDTFDLFRVKSALETSPDSEIIIVANKKDTAYIYWNRIKEHVKTDKKPFVISNANTNDGFPFPDAIVLMVDRWWENKNAKSVMFHLGMSKIKLPITHIPPCSEKR